MLQSTVRRYLAANLILLCVGFAATASADAGNVQIYQFLKATDSRVWRLNTQTGEIAVCSLSGEQLVCASSTQAITVPAKTYAELEAARQAQQQLDSERREEQRKRSLAMVDLMINAFRGLAAGGSGAGDPN